MDSVNFRIYGSGIVTDWCVWNNELLFVLVLLKLVNNNYIGSRFCSVLFGIIFKLYLVFGSTIILGFVVFCSKLYLNFTLQLIPKDKDDKWLWKCRTVFFSNFRSRVMLEFLNCEGTGRKTRGRRKKKPWNFHFRSPSHDPGPAHLGLNKGCDFPKLLFPLLKLKN